MPYYPPATAATGGQTSSANKVSATAPNGITTVYTTPEAYIPGSLKVHMNGQRLTVGSDYTETSTLSFTFATAPLTGDAIVLDYRTI